MPGLVSVIRVGIVYDRTLLVGGNIVDQFALTFANFKANTCILSD